MKAGKPVCLLKSPVNSQYTIFRTKLPRKIISFSNLYQYNNIFTNPLYYSWNLIYLKRLQFDCPDQSFPGENHSKCYKKLASRSWLMLFTLYLFFLIHTLFLAAKLKVVMSTVLWMTNHVNLNTLSLNHCCCRGWEEVHPPAENLLIPPTWNNPPHQIFIPPH